MSKLITWIRITQVHRQVDVKDAKRTELHTDEQRQTASHRAVQQRPPIARSSDPFHQWQLRWNSPAFRPKLLSWPKLSCRYVENDVEIEHMAQHSTNLDLHRSTKWFMGSYIIGIPWCSIRTLWKVMERISYCSHGYLLGRASILASKTPPRSPLNFCTWRLCATIPQQLKICKVSTCRTILAVEDYLKQT